MFSLEIGGGDDFGICARIGGKPVFAKAGGEFSRGKTLLPDFLGG